MLVLSCAVEAGKNISATHALLSFIYYLLNRSDEPNNVIRIFLLDFAKAFDHIDHKHFTTQTFVYGCPTSYN